MNAIVNALTIDHPSPRVSDRYMFISSKDIIRTLEEANFKLDSVTFRKNRSENGTFYGRHLVKMYPATNEYDTDEYRFQALFQNSHDGRCSYHVWLGLFKFICSNGLVIGTAASMTATIIHIKSAREAALEVQKMVEQIPTVCESVKLFKAKELTAIELKSFAKSALALRYGNDFLKLPSINDYVETVLYTRRGEDEGRSVWNVLNRVQENIIQGRFRPEGTEAAGPVAPIRPLTRIAKSTAVNTGLWNLAESYAKAA